jgi:transporter family-2 protein
VAQPDIERAQQVPRPLRPGPAAGGSPPAPGTVATVAVAVGAGALVAVQLRVNGGLDDALGDAVVAALVSFGTGLVAISAVVLARRASRAAAPLVRTVPWWSRLGGLGGASLVAVSAAAAPVIGVALLTVAIVGGQTAGGLAVDGVGLGPGGRRPLTAPRLAGALLCLVAIVVSVAGKAAKAASPLLLVLVVAAGLMVSLQQALNGRVRHATGDAAVATLVNFVIGTTALLAGLLLRAALVGVHVARWPGLSEWYLYSGGLLGATFVGIAAVVVRPLGVLRLGLATTAGQLVGAVLLDAFLPEHGHGVATATVVGAVLTLVAVAVSGAGRRR